MNTVLDVVQSLQEMKKSQLKWVGLSFTERSQTLLEMADQIESRAQELAQALAESQKIPFEFVLHGEVQPALRHWRKIAVRQPDPGTWPKPTGLISVLLPDFFPFRLMMERLVSGLLAGNGLFIGTSPVIAEIASFFRELLPVEAPVRIFSGGEDLQDLLIAHPGIQAVSFYGAPDRAEAVLRSLSGTWKKWQISAGFHNSALILSDADLTQAASQLVESCFTGWGRWPWNISTIYVGETQAPAFQEIFGTALKKKNWQPMPEALHTRILQLAQQFKSEKAKILFGGEVGRPLVVEDLSHCSTLQQDCLAAPLVLISPVKYAHEMVKWANTSYYGMSAQVFGSQEKVEKFAAQLDVSRVSANSWVETMETLPLGIKQSFSGIPDLDPFGGFFSDLRKIDGLESKN